MSEFWNVLSQEFYRLKYVYNLYKARKSVYNYSEQYSFVHIMFAKRRIKDDFNKHLFKLLFVNTFIL